MNNRKGFLIEEKNDQKPSQLFMQLILRKPSFMTTTGRGHMILNFRE